MFVKIPMRDAKYFLVILFLACRISGEEGETRVSIADIGYSQSENFADLEVSFLGYEKDINSFMAVYSTHKTLSVYCREPISKISFGILSTTLSGISALVLMVPWGIDSKPLGYTVMTLHLLPLILNPELKIFPRFVLSPYFGYDFDMISDSGLNPIFLVKEGAALKLNKTISMKFEAHQRLLNKFSATEGEVTLQFNLK